MTGGVEKQGHNNKDHGSLTVSRWAFQRAKLHHLIQAFMAITDTSNVETIMDIYVETDQ